MFSQWGKTLPAIVAPAGSNRSGLGGNEEIEASCVEDYIQTTVVLKLTPIFEADLRPERYAYREGRSAQDR